MSAGEDRTMPEPVATFVAAVNAHDTEQFLDSFTADGFVDDWGRIFRGRKEISGWNDREFIGSRPTLTVREVSTRDDGTVDVLGDWRSSHANGLSLFSFRVDGDKLRSMIIREG